jgi:hypothetical protein
LLPYPTATQPPPDVDWIITIEVQGITEPIAYSFQSLTEMLGHGVTFVPDAMPNWVEMPADKTEWAGWEGIYVNRLLPDDMWHSRTITITNIKFVTDDGQSVELHDPWQGNAPVIALKNGKGEWLANSPGSPGPVRLIVIGRPPDLWIYRVTKIIIE